MSTSTTIRSLPVEKWTNHGLQRRPRVDVFEVVSRSRGPAEPYRSSTESTRLVLIDAEPKWIRPAQSKLGTGPALAISLRATLGWVLCFAAIFVVATRFPALAAFITSFVPIVAYLLHRRRRPTQHKRLTRTAIIFALIVPPYILSIGPVQCGVAYLSERDYEQEKVRLMRWRDIVYAPTYAITDDGIWDSLWGLYVMEWHDYGYDMAVPNVRDLLTPNHDEPSDAPKDRASLFDNGNHNAGPR